MIPFFENFASRSPEWLDGSGPSSDIVVSTRARLARNLKAFPFPHHASVVELGTIFGDLNRRLARFPEFAKGWFLEMNSLEPAMVIALREMGLSALVMNEHKEHRGLVVSEDLDQVVIINGEDHFHLVAFRAGFDPQGALANTMSLDDRLDPAIDVAFDGDLGYLTSSPVDLGTGLHISALLHLPGLVLAGEIEKVLNALRQLQFSVKGMAGDGGTVRGALFRVSNLMTLGRDEQEIVEDFKVHVGKVVIYERAARDQLHARDPLGIEDLAHRSLATVRQARLITSQEASDHLSSIRLGVGLGILDPILPGVLNRALMRQQTGHLQVEAGRNLVGREKTAARAALLREVFAVK